MARLCLIALTALGFYQVPTGYIPAQDKQYLIGFAQLPDGATLDRTEEVIRKMSDIARRNVDASFDLATSLAGAIAIPQSAQSPYEPSRIRASAASTSVRSAST
mgnify:CR=1 FL=1